MPKHNGHDEVVRLLLESGADPHSRGTALQLTPLAVAVTTGEPRFVAPLRAAMGELDLFHAALLGDLGLVSRFVESDAGRSAATTADENGWPAILYVGASRLRDWEPGAEQRLADVAALLLSHGADANAAATVGMYSLPAFYFAAGCSNQPKVARLLLEAGANPNDGESLFHAAENMFVECLEMLLEYGGDLNSVDHHGHNTPLFYVLKYTRLDSVPWLLEHGADPNICNGEELQTALHAAAQRGCNDDILTLLIEHGANIDAPDADGATPLRLAEIRGKHRVVELLQRHGSMDSAEQRRASAGEGA